MTAKPKPAQGVKMKSDNALPTLKAVPPRIPEELLPVYDWWVKSGPRTLLYAGIFAVVAAGAVAWNLHKQNQREAANAALIAARSAEDFESFIANYSTPATKLARLELARAYYDVQDYDQAMETYEAFLKDTPPAAFTDIAVLGKAQCLEALGRYSEALAAYKAFTDEKGETHYLTPSAIFGTARTIALTGDKAAGKAALDVIIKAEPNTPYAAYALAAEALKKTIDLYTPRKNVSRFDQLMTLTPDAPDAAAALQIAAPEAAPAAAPEAPAAEAPAAPEAAPAPAPEAPTAQ